ncbi:MAG TPA: transketolase C-terminal domain-containing protein [Bacillota bacterium]|nr:transketolase C-terminal domain-containing protein [Bacillota bacterium]HOR85640.1 transketolase C-terminal domain-containing protein [Bacillota bacterium]HPL54363.1 transketolase C-terminal domain-containing protein [Bacillota bacterium]
MLEMDRISTRQAFGNAVLRLAEKDENVIAVAADTGKSMGLGAMAKRFPDRVIDVGIAEQNMMTLAAGAASIGNLVFAASYSVFTCMRALEEVRTFIAYPNLNVKVAGGMAGLSGSVEGVTHQSIEDIAFMRAIPNMTVVVPADAASTEVIVEEISKYNGPAYIRLGRYEVPKVFDSSYKFILGKANVLKESGKDATIICNGVMVGRSIEAEKILAANGYNVRLVEMASVKPIDEECIMESAKKTGAIVTVEEHTVMGGLGSAVAEVVVRNSPVPMKFVGINDIFAESGEHEKLLDKFGLSVQDIVNAVKEVVSKK